ncbi:hypothetical protein [Xylocopilactobacillus apicola]|uniref:Uncharacterized protein n=1 Tax=Xylocopilactobacillus apicola TaxID=2932184 RepID=A0AAU9DW81_9LACO|nr:hypothetical protein [Xylocopilactobacillus apicola]BDR58218.1 hypothetical protein XA3_06590 [Xylocopilactobacillus apicola]
MEFNEKNIYFIDTDAPIDLGLIVKRIKQLGAQQVKATHKSIDYLIYDEDIDHDLKLQARFERLKKNKPVVISPLELIKEMGFKPNEAYIQWDPYPNYDPWTGDKLSLWEN